MCETQLALVKAGRERDATRVDTVRRPSPGPGQVRLRVEACGICGSDVHAWRGDDGYDWVTIPVVLGHEVVGVVDALGEGVPSHHLGTRTVPLGIDGCHQCTQCLAGLCPLCADRAVLGLSFDGGCAPSVVVPAERLVPVDATAPATRMVLTEPMSVAAHAIARLDTVREGMTIGVSGPGPIGLFAAWLLRRTGADVVLTGTPRDEPVRLAAARTLELRTCLADDLADLPPVDAWIEASGSESGLGTSIRAVAPGGTVVVVALFGRPPVVRINELVRREVRVFGSYASVRRDYEVAAAALARADGFEDVVSTVFPLTRGVQALEATADADVVKAVLVP